MANADSTPQLLSTKRRAAGPILSPEHFRSAKSLSGSNVTTGTSSSFLTPFLPGPRSMSPPPKPEADDYLNVHGHYNDGKRHHKTRGRKRYDPIGEDDEPRADPITPASKPRTTSSAGSDCELCAIGGHSSDLDSAPGPQLVKGRKQLFLRTDTRALADDMDIDPTQDRTWPRLSTSISRDDGAESPAVNALRSLSQPQPTKSDLESQKLRRMSSALANTFNFLKSRTSTTNSVASIQSMSPKWNLPSGKRSTNTRSLAFRDSDRRRPTFRDGKEGSGTLTPSSITLRKASNANATTLPGSSMSASLSYEDENLRSSEAPASELLAFYSSKNNETSTPTSTDFPSPVASLSPLNLTQEKLSDIERRLSQTTCPPMVHFSNVRRQSVPASNILTFIDVHIAPGTFAVDAESKKRSLAVADSPTRRISVVQFRSRDSIHEVIWREDETTGCSSLASSSRTSTSPPRIDQSMRPAELSREAEEGQMNTMPVVSGSSSMIEQPQVGLFQWSWGKTANTSDVAVQVNERKSNCPDLTRLTSASNPDSSRTRRSSDAYAAIGGNKPSVLEVQDILSFPPLRDRSSTLEWQKAPLIDINAPLANGGDAVGSYEVTDMYDQTPPERARGDPTLLREGFSGRRSSSHPYPPARNGLSGRVGSSVGSSSHVRVRHGHTRSSR